MLHGKEDAALWSGDTSMKVVRQNAYGLSAQVVKPVIVTGLFFGVHRNPFISQGKLHLAADKDFVAIYVWVHVRWDDAIRRRDEQLNLIRRMAVPQYFCNVFYFTHRAPQRNRSDPTGFFRKLLEEVT